jgi:hypothetical protein
MKISSVSWVTPNVSGLTELHEAAGHNLRSPETTGDAMDRHPMSGNVPAEYAEQESDSVPPLSYATELEIDRETDRLMFERMYELEQYFDDFMESADSEAINRPLQGALRALDGACNGEVIPNNVVLRNLHQVQKVVKNYAAEHWFEECRQEAEEAITHK